MSEDRPSTRFSVMHLRGTYGVQRVLGEPRVGKVLPL